MSQVPESPEHESTGALPEAAYRTIFQKVPRLTVEVVVCSDQGVLLARRIGGPCDGLWNLPGGTVRFAEPLTQSRSPGRAPTVGEALATVPGRLDWFSQLPDQMHAEQRTFLRAHDLAG